jgi:hypothetical protein
MVKRTLLVFGIVALLTIGAGMAPAQAWLGGPPAAQSWVNGFPGDCGTCPPLFVPAPCCEYPESKTIVKTWSCKIEGPCPPPGAPCGAGSCGQGGTGNILGSLCFLMGSIATPFDLLFGGFDGVYGCCPGLGALGIGCSGPCGPCYGPVPGLIAGVVSCLSPPQVMFGCYW